MTNHIFMILWGHYFYKWKSKKCGSLETVFALFLNDKFNKSINPKIKNAHKSEKVGRFWKYI